jgi:hypothetical protein
MLFSQKNYFNLHAGNHHDTGERTNKYNCIGWAIGRDDQWVDPADPEEWEENFYWPENVPRDYKITSLIMVFELAGFAICADASLEDGVEKIAIYADGDEWMHAARQLDTGKWTSKMGPDERIEHDTPEDLAGPWCGQVKMFMQRKPKGTSHAN